MFALKSTDWILGFAIAMASALSTSAVLADDAVEYNRDVRPILSDRCFQCHGPDASKRQAKLRLDVESIAKAKAIVANRPAKSPVIERIVSDDEDVKMPPVDSGKKLSAAEIEILRKWIAQGAKYQPHWAYVPPVRHPVPRVKDAHWPTGWIDSFLLHRMEVAGFLPSPDADKVTLIRRVSFDLTGLPPSYEQVRDFESDRSDTAFEKVVDRLLASDRYGERMAVYWLDLVRYADTVGYHGDQEHHISPYRDYVIDAFNDNLPFDRFTAEQLAGDLLPGSGVDQKIASGYNRLLQTSHEGGVQAKEYLAIYAADHVRNVSAVWMGATVGCAQCHDHKFDPYTAKDFYSLAAFFADVDEAQHLKKGSDATPTVRLPEIKVLTKRERQRLESLETKRKELEERAKSATGNIGDETKRQLAECTARLDASKKNARKTMITVAIAPRTMRVLPRGNWLDDSGPVVVPSPPAFLLSTPNSKTRLTRLDLANWLTDPKAGVGGLTARVFVNRLWSLFFETGLSKSMEDFGGQGEPPTHPELLDNLAVDFFEHGWDVKRAVKQIVMSRAYRQSSLVTSEMRERDPGNRLYARQARFRLPAEMIRDNALTVSGLLVLDYGGPSVRPYQPEGYYRHLNFPKRTYKHDTDTRQWRRGVYVHWQRQYLHPMLKAFDAPSREECTAQRIPSNTPLAALVLLNDPTFVEAARSFAGRLLTGLETTDTGRIASAFRSAVSRDPDDIETKTLLTLLQSQRDVFSKDESAANRVTKIGLSQPVKGIAVVEHAAWTMVARAILNLDEVIARN